MVRLSYYFYSKIKLKQINFDRAFTIAKNKIALDDDEFKTKVINYN